MASSLGIATAFQRLVPEYRTRGDFDGLRGYLAGSRLMGFGLGTAAGVLLAGSVLALSDGIPTYYVIPFRIASLTLPIFTAASVQDLMGRALNWIDLALLLGFIAHPLAILAVMSALHAQASRSRR
jgi:O-antigen/teichoic acid export membrane protein